MFYEFFFYLIFFFFKQKTAYEMRISDWSSDVCSSDLRSEGSPKPSLKERAVAFARERGVIRTKDLTSIGIPRCYLSPMCDEGLLVRVGYGRDRKSTRLNSSH